MRRKIIYTFLGISLLSLVAWGIQVYIKPFLSDNVLLYLTIFAYISGILANLIGNVEFVKKWFEESVRAKVRVITQLDDGPRYISSVRKIR